MKYPGKLGKKRKGKKRNISLLADDAEVKRKSAQWAMEDLVLDMEGLKLLRAHYGITDPSDFGWMQLSILLARDCVPYFQRDDKRGAPRDKNIELHCSLYIAVFGLQESGEATSLPHACRILRARGYAQAEYPDVESMVDAVKNFKKKNPFLVDLVNYVEK